MMSQHTQQSPVAKENPYQLRHEEIIMNDTGNFSSIKGILFIILKLLVLILKVLYYICEGTYRLFVPRQKKDVSGEVVLITGAGDGIGKELAIGYASLGATVICWDINKESNEQTMNEIKAMGKSSVYAYQCDVSNKNEVFKMAEKIKMEVGDVTILINNAGIAPVKTLQNYNIDEISRVINVNLMAHYWTMKAFLPSMIEKNHGHIVAVSSLAALFGKKYGTLYCATKAAVRLLMESIADELHKGKSCVKTTTIFPCFVTTNLIKNLRIRYGLTYYSPQQAASLIIDAQRQDYKEKYFPTISSLLIFARILPNKALKCLIDLLEIDADEDD
ncbi:short-chain dehydrogenase/reductase family 16C member 6-like [Odontomachus brunneus]|uniref:short-chain dehydrogenase/reductase family 16C member 6-like n=1 Tax=Odontomachus brunneus TaxID=486640 RepID=UPI0013F1DD7A|nr:short-chain dehydrogenase/reductase family 16C member 6-like [Odontomachus brunneus]